MQSPLSLLWFPTFLFILFDLTLHFSCLTVSLAVSLSLSPFVPLMSLSHSLLLQRPTRSQAVVLCLPGLLSWSTGFLSTGTEQGLAGRYTEKSQLQCSHCVSHTLTLLPILSLSHTSATWAGHSTRYDVCNDAA